MTHKPLETPADVRDAGNESLFVAALREYVKTNCSHDWLAIPEPKRSA